MKKNVRTAAITVIVVLGLIYIVTNIRRSSPQKTPAQPPILSQAPARVYGQIEPEGGNVYVTAPKTRQIIKIYVKEGDTVKAGHKLCTLENSVEKAQALSDLAKVDLAEKSWDISKDEFHRNQALYDSNSISEYEYTRSKLKAEFDSLNLLAAIKDAELASAQLDQLDLKSPIDGVVYKFDVRLGESLPEGDNSFIIVGKPSFWVRLYVESFWTERVAIGDEYVVKDSETNEIIGTGTVISKTPYLGGKVFRSNDPFERFDIKYQEVILTLERAKENIPIGLSVLAEIEPN
ncbi:MAG: HlyD family efflux transporter periplasmic adaptor subunit [candidate division Zixibacteria bacterium]|nr:HlyD family efflux transporter periplasmic adaptor subunit [candidate division Zixibacteria bacterium]